MAAALLAGVSAKPQEDLIADRMMPRFNMSMQSDVYSGYLNVSETKALHYVFAESQNDPSSDPVLIWFNGGPGCSSLLGFFQENGPIIVDGGEYRLNDQSWNQKANVLYLEQPAGVGFTKYADQSELYYNDTNSSADAYKGLDSWYDKFPEYLENDLYISGESYGGIYVPYLAW